MERQIILLNGPSSSGKSTLAKALQELIFEKRSERYGIVSIDDFLKMSIAKTIYEDDVFEKSDILCSKALEMLEKEKLSSGHMKMVRISCPLHLLKKRESERGDRCPGSAEASEKYLFPRDGYDLVVDTGTSSPAENALVILDNLF